MNSIPSQQPAPPPSPPENDRALNENPVRASAQHVTGFGGRTIITASILGAFALVQLILLFHVRSAGDVPLASLSRKLVEFPLTLPAPNESVAPKIEGISLPSVLASAKETWKSTGNEEITSARELIGNEHLKRTYSRAGGNQVVQVWMVFSFFGLDRAHHPEVCYAVADRPEITGDRGQLAAPGHRAPIQRYRFGGNGYQWVYYWTYEIPPAYAKELSIVQRFYQVNRCRKPSITIEVFANEVPGFNLESVDRFVLELDRNLQSFVGERAVRRSERTPVTIVSNDKQEEHN